jgi:hypothetical protein
VLLALFLASTLPFAAATWRTDPLVAMLSPVLLGLRALALLFGTAAGMARFRPFLGGGAR